MTGDAVCCSCGPTSLIVAPAWGGSVVSLRVQDRDVFAPVFPHPLNRDLLVSGIVLTPFSNRIGNGAFTWDGAQQLVPRTLDYEPFPIHGDGFLQAWAVLRATQTELSLRLLESTIGPFRYSADQHFRITENSFAWSVSLKNLSVNALPYGTGLHPWFPRSAATRLMFAASGVWLSDAQRLPLRCVPVDTLPAWNFAQARPLPDTEIDHAFTGWNGSARIEQGPDHMSLTLAASDNLGTAVVYAPSPQIRYFCFEPVSHPIDAHNLPGRPGLAILAPGQTLEASMQVRWAC